MKKLAIFALLAMTVMLLCWGCSDDDKDQPLTGTLAGQVIFHGAWPDSGHVQLSVFTNWTITTCSWCPDPAGGPPAYYTHRDYFQDPNPDNGDGPDTVSYEITGITLGTYACVAVGWRSPTQTGDIACEEPVLGMYGADPFTTDSIPQAISFSESQPRISNAIVHAYFNLPPPAGCDNTGIVEGVVRVNGPWPAEGLLVLISAYPFTPWIPPLGAPTAYFSLLTANDTSFHFTPRLGTYYLSLWNNVAPPTQPYWFGSYGVRSGDARPDAILINPIDTVASGIVMNGNSPAPHWISGTITFNGTRPSEGLLVLFSTFPYTPEHPPTGAPSGYCPVTNPSETLYAMTGLPEGTYYVSLWNNVAPPTVPTFYGAHGYTAGSDTDPDPVVLGSTQTEWGKNGIHIIAP